MSEVVVLGPSPDDARLLMRPRRRSRPLILSAGLVLLAVAVGGYELATLAMSGRYSPVTLGEIWYALDVGSLNLVQAVIQRFLHPALWDPLIVWLLRWPVWSLFGGIGVVLTTIHLARSR